MHTFKLTKKLILASESKSLELYIDLDITDIIKSKIKKGISLLPPKKNTFYHFKNYDFTTEKKNYKKN